MIFTDGVVRFRAIEPDDLPALQQWINDPETSEYLAMSWPVSCHDQQEWYERVRAARDRRKFIIERVEGEPLGLLSLTNIDPVNRSVEIGLTIGVREFRGKGLGSRSLRLAVDVLFQRFNYHRIWAQIVETNDRSLHLFRRAGFQQEGILRESVYSNGRMIGKVLMAMLRR
jgi:RimJ/RimL family protein N-acetyltransferase